MGRGRIVWCESLLSLLRNVELWKWLIWLFDMWSMCFFFLRVHFSSLSALLLPSSPFVLCVSGCRGSGPGGGYPPVGPRQAQPHRVSEERGQPADAPTQQWASQSYYNSHTFGAWEGLPCLSLTLTVLLFVCVCITLCHVQCFGESQYLRVMRKVAAVCFFISVCTVKVKTTAVPGS